MDKVMNLGKYLAQQLLEADQKTVAIFPGAFKPPHKGHLEVAKMLLKEADELIILISPILRDGIDADESVAVWELYKLLLDGPAEIRVAAGSPIKETYEIVKNNPDTNFIVAFGKGEAERFKAMTNYPNVKVFDGGYIQDANATQLRQALDSKDETAMQKYLPNGISPVDFLKAIGRRSTISPQEPTQLQEVQPMDTTSPYHDLVVSELGKIDSTAQKFNVPINDLQYAFEAGRENILTDDIWSKLENSDSYQIKNLEQAIKLADKYKKDWRSIVRAIQNEKQLPLPLVLNYAKDKYYLVGGNARLMFYKALGVQPIVLLGTIDLTIDEDSEVFDLNTIKLKESQTATVGEFIKYAIKNLAIQNPPRNLTLSYDNDQAKTKRSFGYFDPNDNKIWVYVKNRNMADILRTLAHELVHRRQAELGMIDNMSGETGSTIENEANAMAGVLLRDFGKINDSIYEHKKMVKLIATKKNILKEVQQLSISNSIIFGVEHYSESDAKQVVDYVKKNFSPDDKVAFMGEGGDGSNKYVAGSEQEIIYDELSSYFKNLVNDSWDGSDLNVMDDKSLLYKIQKEKTGLSYSKILAANWASMVGQNILQGQSIADFAPQDYLSPEGIKFLKASAQEAELLLSDNLYEPTAKDYDTLYRLSFPADYGDKYTKVAKVADAFNEARDENLLSKLKKYESKGYKVIATAGEGHIDLIKAMLKNKK
jgi:cytidyltransferase-like protein